MLAVTLALVVVTHVVSLLIAPVLAGVCVAVAAATRHAQRAAWIVPMTRAVLGAAGLAAFWLWPYARHLDERGAVSAWPTPSLVDRLADIAGGRILFPAAWFAGAVLAGWVWVVIVGRRRHPLLGAAIAAPVVFLVFAHALHAWSPDGEIAVQLANRGLGYAGLLAVIPLGALVAEVVGRARRIPAAEIATVGGAVLLVLAASSPLRAIPRQQPEPVSAMAQTAATLRRVVPVQGRFVTERDFPTETDRLGVRHPDFWLAARSGRNTVNTFGVELSASPDVRFLSEFLATGHDLVDTSMAAYARNGVTHIVTLLPATTARLLATDEVGVVARHGQLTVLEILSPAGQPPPGALLTVDHGTAAARVTHWRDNGGLVVLRLDTSQLTTASVAIGWANGWRATLDGTTIPVLRRSDGLVGVTLPGGRHDLVLRYEPAPLDGAGLWVSLATAVAGLVWLRPRRSALEGSDG